MFCRSISLIVLFLISLSSGTEVIGGVATPGKICRDCWQKGLYIRISPNSVSPQFTVRYKAFEIYLGVSAAGTDDTLWASAKKYKNSAAGTLYLAEVDSYSLDFTAYLVQPEVGFRIYFLPRRTSTPYLNLGLFWIIPIVKESYEENFYHYNDSGEVIKQLKNTSSGGPQISTSGVYELGIHIGIGGHYRVNKHFAVFGEFAVRAIMGGADLSYNYFHDLIEPAVVELQKDYWLGGAKLSALSTTGYLGIQFYW